LAPADVILEIMQQSGEPLFALGRQTFE